MVYVLQRYYSMFLWPVLLCLLLSQVKFQMLIVFSPVAEIAFDEKTKDQKTGKYQSFFTLTNPNEAGQVAYKIKTNFPDRYHVKPSNGCVDAGNSCYF